MQVFLAEVGLPSIWSATTEFRALAARRPSARHTLTDDPERADIVLFTECHQLPDDWRLETIARSPMARNFPEKTFVYDERDRPWCRLPGLYVSMPRPAFEQRWQRPWLYPVFRMAPPALDGSEVPDLLFSFVGSPTHPVRGSLFELRHPRAHISRTDGFVFHDKRSEDFEGRRQAFAESLARSKFVLCPRGAGTSSIRLLETMRAGRVPVVLSDDWVAPPGPDWSSFTIRHAENDVGGLVAVLEGLEPDAKEMGERARSAYDAWFGADVAFDRMIDLIGQLIPGRAAFPARGVWNRQAVHLAAADLRQRLRSTARAVVR